MSSSTLLIVFSVVFFTYSAYGIKKRYYAYKQHPDYTSISVFWNKVAGMALALILLALHFLGCIPYNE